MESKQEIYTDLEQNETNRYKLILKQVIPYIQDLIDVVEGESANSYYSIIRNMTLPISDAKNILKLLQSETYGI